MSGPLEGLATLSILLSDDQPPGEFRLFEAGINTTDKGTFIFDAPAADSVMDAFKAKGVDLMIDLEHLSLNSQETNFDPDARAWGQLELRDGELWAVGVKWTQDGAERLTQKRQRYVSPAFFHTASGHITRIQNVALTALPATHGTPELVAARRNDIETAATLAHTGSGKMNPKLIMEAIAAVKGKDGKGALALLERLIAAAVGVEEVAPDPADADPAPPAAEVAAVIADSVPEAAKAAAASALAALAAPEPMTEVAAATARLSRITGKTTLSAAVDETEAWRQSHLSVVADRAKLADERKALEAGERHSLVAQLVKLRAEDPATAWEDFASEKPAKPVKRLADEPIAGLRDRVAKLAASRGGDSPPTPPAGSGGELTPAQLQICKDTGCEPAVFAQLSAQRNKALGRN